MRTITLFIDASESAFLWLLMNRQRKNPSNVLVNFLKTAVVIIWYIRGVLSKIILFWCLVIYDGDGLVVCRVSLSPCSKERRLSCLVGKYLH